MPRTETPRRCIAAVTPLEGYVLRVDFLSGGQLLLPMERWLDHLRFAPLRRAEVWRSATTDGRFVRFGSVEVSHDELLDMAEYGRDGSERRRDGSERREYGMEAKEDME